MLNDPHLPPMFSGHSVKAPDRAFAVACAGAANGKFGAADFIWARNHATAECALVLEPDVDFARALQMAPLMEVALAEALGSVCPPQVAVEFRWPGFILVNGGLAGRVCRDDHTHRHQRRAKWHRRHHGDRCAGDPGGLSGRYSDVG